MSVFNEDTLSNFYNISHFFLNKINLGPFLWAPHSSLHSSMLTSLFAFLATLLLHQPAAAVVLYGLTRVACPTGVPHAVSGCMQLVSVDGDTGELVSIGAGHNPLGAVGDLRVIAGGVYYVLADNCGGPCKATGTVLLGISLKDGSEVCRAQVPTLAQVGLVGGGQSISHDTKKNRLLLTGMNSTDGGNSYTHVLLSAPLAPSGCGPFSRIGAFGDADYEPMAHGSELDVDGARLFITLSTGAHSYGMGVVDVATGNLTTTYPMENSRTLWGPTYVSSAGRLVGVGVDESSAGGIDWRTLDPSTGTWTSAPLKYAPSVNVTFPGLEGNLGSVRAFDSAAGTLYVMAGRGDPSNPTLEVVQIDVRSGTLVAHSGPLHGDVGVSGSILEQLSASPSAP